MKNSIIALALLAAAAPAFAAWIVDVSEDEMTGEKNGYAMSDLTSSTKPMAFPYTGAKSRLVVACNAKGEWVYTYFTKGPNISASSKETERGYSVVKTRVRWDDQIKPVSMIQEWGGDSLHFTPSAKTIKDITAYKTALLELNWHGNGLTYFKFDLTGAADAIAKMRKECASK